MMRVNQTTSDPDLALALENEHGTFLAQKGGQCFLGISEEGHSIASLRSVGKPVLEPAATTADQPWYITKISSSTEPFSEQGSYSRRRERVEQRT